jgi:uncharacterized protein YbjT (DUF2867 family)
MSRYAVVGASSGTGAQIVTHLAARGIPVRAISRNPRPHEDGVEPYAADVTDPAQLAKALDGEFDAVFFTVDIQGSGLKRDAIRTVMYDGCINSIRAARSGGARRFVLLSVIAPDRFSWVWWVLNAIKPGMRRNILDREEALRTSGIPYVIVRAPRLNDSSGGASITATLPEHRLDMTRGIARTDLAHALIRAAQAAPENSIWDIYVDADRPAPKWVQSDS